MKKILVIHGPNLNLLGSREPDRYGHVNLETLDNELVKKASETGFELSTFQSNIEGEIVDCIQNAKNSGIQHIIINAAAYTHTSIAIRDALLAVKIPFIEVHISNIYSRETFRQQSYLSDIAAGVICGFGINSYFLALAAISHH